MSRPDLRPLIGADTRDLTTMALELSFAPDATNEELTRICEHSSALALAVVARAARAQAICAVLASGRITDPHAVLVAELRQYAGLE